LTVPFLFGSCGQKSGSQNEQVIANADKVDSFDSGDTTAKVKELISYYRTPYSMLDNWFEVAWSILYVGTEIRTR